MTATFTLTGDRPFLDPDAHYGHRIARRARSEWPASVRQFMPTSLRGRASGFQDCIFSGYSNLWKYEQRCTVEFDVGRHGLVWGAYGGQNFNLLFQGHRPEPLWGTSHLEFQVSGDGISLAASIIEPAEGRLLSAVPQGSVFRFTLRSAVQEVNPCAIFASLCPSTKRRPVSHSLEMCPYRTVRRWLAHCRRRPGPIRRRYFARRVV